MPELCPENGVCRGTRAELGGFWYMPIYEYCCDNCLHRFELKRSFHDNSTVTCPKCSSGVRQVFSPSPVIFKGSGFYVTDVKRAKEKPAVSESEDKKPAKEAVKEPEKPKKSGD
jgi:putative FmdB family regulatory protein